MEQYIPKSVLVAEIENRIKETESMQPKFDQFWAGQISAYKGVLKIIDTLEVKDLQEKSASIWHDTNQQPEINTPILVRTYDNIVESTKRYDDNLIPWEDRIKRDDITHWCYVEDLIKTIKL